MTPEESNVNRNKLFIQFNPIGVEQKSTRLIEIRIFVKYLNLNNNFMVIIIDESTTKAKFDILLKKLKVKKGFDAKKFCGVIKLNEDPLELQKRFR